MKTFADFYDLVMPDLNGCTAGMVDHQLLQVARDFCVKTGAWRLPYDAMNLRAGIATYEIEPPEFYTEVVKLFSLSVAGILQWRDSDMEPRDDEDCPEFDRSEPPFSLSSDMKELTLLGILVPAGDVERGLLVVGSMKPTMAANKLPDFLHSQYSEAIRAGVLARLMIMRKRPWTDAALGTKYEADYRKAINFAAYQAQVGNTRSVLRARKYG